ncbi:MAG: hypothetical protein KC496_07090 [Anaerolineae bacterium]|nr:hypothetical protein [Anaerolineae bacterium]
MSASYSLDTDLKEAKAMADALENYVRGDTLYGSAGGGFFSSMPSLTVGALVMRLRRLDAQRDQMQDRQRKILDAAVHHYESVVREWTEHYEQKMLREVNSRLDAMSSFFKECAESERQCASVYRPEQLRRTIVQELLREMDARNVTVGKELEAKVRNADKYLRGFFRPAEFEWADKLQSIYPENEFWWLYQRPPVPENA